MEGDVEQQHHDDGAEHVEHRVGGGGLLRSAVGVERGEDGCDGGADVIAQHDGKGGPEVQQAATGQGDGQADGGCTALDDHGRKRADADGAEHRAERHGPVWPGRAVERLEELNEAGERPRAFQFRSHECHAEEEQSEAQDGAEEALPDCFACDEDADDADDDGGQRDPVELERDDLPGDRGADVRAKDHADGLAEREQPGVDEADGHDRGSARGLDQGGDDGSRKDGSDAVLRDIGQRGLHLVARDLLQAFAQKGHAVDEEGDAAENADEHPVRAHRHGFEDERPGEEAGLGVGHLRADLVNAGGGAIGLASPQHL